MNSRLRTGLSAFTWQNVESVYVGLILKGRNLGRMSKLYCSTHGFYGKLDLENAVEILTQMHDLSAFTLRPPLGGLISLENMLPPKAPILPNFEISYMSTTPTMLNIEQLVCNIHLKLEHKLMESKVREMPQII